MNLVNGFWVGLADRKKFVAVFSTSWFATYVLDRSFDFLFGQFAIQGMFGFIWSLIRVYLLTSNVAFFVFGALVVAFFTDIQKFLARIRLIVASKNLNLPTRIYVAAIVTAATIIAVAATAVWIISRPSQTADDPHTFAPPMSATRDARGTPRLFAHLTLYQIQAELDRRTDLQRKIWVRANQNKWIAVTGKLVDSDFIEKSPFFFDKDVVKVRMEGSSLNVDLYFDVVWQSRIADIAKGGKTFAVCRIGGKSFFENVFLVDCEPVSGPR